MKFTAVNFWLTGPGRSAIVEKFTAVNFCPA